MAECSKHSCPRKIEGKKKGIERRKWTGSVCSMEGASVLRASIFLSYLLSKLDLCSSDTSNMLPTVSIDIQQ